MLDSHNSPTPANCGPANAMLIPPLLIVNMMQDATPPPPPAITFVDASDWVEMDCINAWEVRTRCTVTNPDDSLYALELEINSSVDTNDMSWVMEDSDYGMVTNNAFFDDTTLLGDATSTGAGDAYRAYRWTIRRRSDSAQIARETTSQVTKEWGVCA